MISEWTEERLQSYIDNQVEESLTLEYKHADSLGGSDGKKTEISKDVSAMANSAGGVLIYGIAENPDRRHIPEKIDGIVRKEFSKERLEQIIGNIQPPINGLLIHPVPLTSDLEKVVYVVEIPQSTTAHQATDHRYYKRYNFESKSMADYEIRDVMNRMSAPDLSINIGVEGTPEVLVNQEHPNLIFELFNSSRVVNVKVLVSNSNLIAAEYVLAKLFVDVRLTPEGNELIMQGRHKMDINGKIHDMVLFNWERGIPKDLPLWGGNIGISNAFRVTFPLIQVRYFIYWEVHSPKAQVRRGVCAFWVTPEDPDTIHLEPL